MLVRTASRILGLVLVGLAVPLVSASPADAANVSLFIREQYEPKVVNVAGSAAGKSIQVGQLLAGDRVDCGAGRRDDVFIDHSDVAKNCESVDFR